METILKLRDICKAYDKCFNGCPLYDNGECLVCIPPANLDDEQLYLIGKALKGEECQLVRSVEALSYAKAELKAAYDRAKKIGLKEKTRYIIVLEMAIKALEQESCEDAISRQEVLDLIADYDLSMGQVVRGIHALPSVMPQEPRWIPVSERLPKAEYGESDSVLVCFENGTQDVLYFDGSNWRYPTGESYISVNHKNGWHNKVIAWMPLPKPYVSQESKDKEFHCGIEESGGHAYNCGDCPNKCEEWHQWDKEIKKDGND